MSKSFVFLFVLINLAVSCVIITRPVGAVNDSWTTEEPMPFANAGFGVAVVGGKIYAIGGYQQGWLSNNVEYDPATSTWTTKTNMPTSRDNFGIAVWQNRIYVIGGRTYDGVTGVNEIYDLATDTWENRSSMPTPRFSVVANIVGDKIYVIGGAPSVKSGPVNVNEVYDPTTDTWETKTAILNPESAYYSAVVGNKIYVIGALTQIYDTETDTWSLGMPPPTPTNGAVGATTGLLAPKRIYLLGGTLADGNTTNINQIYNPEDDTWTTGTPMTHDRAGLAVAVVNDTVYALGGLHREWHDIPMPSYNVAFNEQYFPAGYIPEFPVWTLFLVALFGLTATVTVYKRRLAS